MRKSDKKKNMEKVNKIFQERNEGIDITKTEEVVKYTHVKDIFPELSNILK